MLKIGWPPKETLILGPGKFPIDVVGGSFEKSFQW
jgi:hypothetical protein